MGKKLRRLLSVILSIAMVLGYIPSTGITAYAGDNDTYTITFSVNGNSKTIEGVTLPHTFSCNYDDNGELDQIIQELYNLNPRESACNYEAPTASGSNSVTCGLIGNQHHYITISSAYGGVATVVGSYWGGDRVGDFTYSLLITCTSSSTTETVATPAFDPAGGEFTEPQNVTISCATEGATIHYTTDGTDPTTSSYIYSDAIAVDATTTIKAIAVKDGMTDSAVAKATYTISAPATHLTLIGGENGEVVMNSGTYGNCSGTSFDVSIEIDLEGEMKVGTDNFINVNEGASINVLSGGEVSFYPAANNTGTITAVPADGYAFTGWYNGETLYSENEALNYKDIGEDLTLTAKFVATGYATPEYADKLVEITDHETVLEDLGIWGNMSEWGISITKEEAIALAQYMSAQNNGANCAVLYDVIMGYDLYYAKSDGGTGSWTAYDCYALDDYLSGYKVYYVPVAKTAAEVTGAPTAKELTYNGSEQELVTSGTASGGTMQYAIGTDGTTAPTEGWTAGIPTAKNAGTYYVWYKAVGDDTHLDSVPVCVEVTINAKTVTVDGITASNKVYDGSKTATLDYSNVAFDGKVGSDNLTVSATGTFASKEANAAAQTVTISNLTLGGDDVANYVLATNGQQSSTTAKINPKEVTLTWGTVDFIYNGEPQAPTCTAGGLVGTDTCTVTVSGEQTNVGTYTAEATELSNSNYKLPATATKTFNITRAEISPTVTVGSWTYGATRNTPTVKGNKGNGAVAFTWKKKDAPDTDYELYDDAHAPTEAGTYVLKADIAETANYKAGSATVNFTISQADIGISVSMADWTYGGTPSNPVVSDYDGNVTFMYKKNGAKDSTYADYTPGTSLDAGAYVLKAVPDDKNVAPATVNFTVEKKEAELIWNAGPYYYDGTDKCPIANVRNPRYGDNIYVTVVGAATAVGFHTARAIGFYGDDAENYKLPADEYDRMVEFEIKSSQLPEYPRVYLAGWTYGDTPNTPTVYGNIEGANVTYEYKAKDASEYSYTTKVPTKAGKYTVKATIAATAGYEKATTTNDFEILPKEVTLQWADTSLKYSGEAQAAKAEITNLEYKDKVDITYNYKKADDPDTEYAEAMPIAAGSYKAKAVSLTGDDKANYKLPNNQNVTQEFSISKGTLEPTVTITGWTYGDYDIEKNAPKVEGNTAGADVTYLYKEKSEESYFETIPTEAGDYTVKAVIASKDNYEGGEATADFTITKRTAELEWSGISCTYDGESHLPTATIRNRVIEDKLTVTVTGAQTKAGNYIATATGITGAASDNYELPSTATQPFTIDKLEVELKWTLGTTVWPNNDNPSTILSISYDAADHCPVAEVTNKVGQDVVNVKVVGAATAVGTHTAEATKLTGEDAGNYILPDDAEITEVPFEITKATSYDPKPVVKINDWTYGDTPSTPVVEGNAEGANVTYRYKKADEDETGYTDKVPTEAGDYVIEATIAATAGYAEYMVTAEFRILPKTVDISWSFEPEYIYSGKSQTPEAEITNLEYGDKIDIAYDYMLQGDETPLEDVPEDAGKYIVKIVGLTVNDEPANNYALPEATVEHPEEPEELTLDYEIKPLTVELEWNETSLEYTGNPQAPTALVDNLVDDDDVEVSEYQYKVDEDGSVYGDDKPSDAGNYFAKAIGIAGDDAENYILLDDDSVEIPFEIYKVSIKPTLTIAEWTYGDTPSVPEVTGYDGEGEETITYYVDDECTEVTTAANSGAAEEGGVPVFAGDYTAKLTIAPNGKYEGGEDECRFTVEKREVELDWGTRKFTYDAKLHVPTVGVENVVTGDEITATATGAQIKAGEYTAKVTGLTGTAKDNYVLPEDATISFVINKKPVTLTWTLGETTWPVEGHPEAMLETAYNAEDQCPEVTLVGVEEADKANVSAKIVGAATTVGTHTAEITKLTGTAAGNYELPDELGAKFRIVKADLDPEKTKVILKDWVYGSNPNVPQVEGNLEGGNVTYMYKPYDAEDSAYTSTVPSLAGDYMVKAVISATAGYNGISVEAKFSITKCPLNLVLTIKDWTYGEPSSEPEITGIMEDGKLTYTYYVDEDCTEVTTAANSGAEADGAKPVYAGDYTLKAEVTETADYQAGEVEVQFTIDRRILSVAAEDKEKVYGEDDPEFTYTYEGLVEGDEIIGALTREAGSDVGEYSILQGTLSAGDNYEIDYTEATLTITKAEIVITPPTAEDLTYDGQEHELIKEGETELGEFTYAFGTDVETAPAESEFDDEVPSATDTAVYYVWYMVKGDKNHFDTVGCVTAEIKEVDKTELNEAIEESEALLESMAGNDDYKDIADALGEAIEDAKDVADNKNVTEAEVKTATEDIEDAADEAAADKLAVDKANFDDAKADAKKAVDNAAKSDDSDACKKLVKDAKTAIDNLKYNESKTPEENQKAVEDIVSKLEGNLKEQRAAEKKAAEEAADTKAAGDVVDKINDLPSPEKISKDDKAAIEAARNAYNALTAEQKAKVNEQTLAKLANAEKALANAEKYSGEWVNGQWYETNGSASYAPKGQWKNDGTGWWYEDSSGWYPKSKWQKIDGKWYYFTADGYMDYSEYRDGCWLGSDGAWVEAYYGGQWMHGASGWWYMDASGWYPVSQYLWIDGVQYWFDANGITN